MKECIHTLIDEHWTVNNRSFFSLTYPCLHNSKYRTFEVLLWVNCLFLFISSLYVCVCVYVDARDTLCILLPSLSSHKILKACVWFPNAKHTNLSVVVDAQSDKLAPIHFTTHSSFIPKHWKDTEYKQTNNCLQMYYITWITLT